MERAHVNPTREALLRRRLGIPEDAQQVLIFGETSHWDPNWLFTSETYYRLRIRRILDAVLRELTREPDRVFSIECLHFLQMYWERNPDKQDTLRALINGGRLRLTGTGMTTPDTVLPETEAILRDYLQGQEWMRGVGLHPEPRIAYLPDNFGHSPALPAVFRALGVDYVGITRIDGMHFIGADYRLASSFPRPGSSAELLLRAHESLDFVWRAPDGSEVLSHWNAFTYFQGDMLAHLGVIRWMGMVLGMPWRTGRHIARRIGGFVRALAPVSRTPYLFCPIGCDFNDPIQGLGALLHRHNRMRYGDTGVWVVSAGLDDYLELVDCHRVALPVLALDPNPYWMGFYASRPDIKRRCKRTTHKLLLAEKLAARSETVAGPVATQLRQAWTRIVLSNHHDFITGTSPDRTWHGEQKPWLHDAERFADEALRLIAREEAEAHRVPEAAAHSPIEWSQHRGRLVVKTPLLSFELAEEVGGCFVGLADASGRARLAGVGNDLVVYRDSGGLWRMGHEYRGGTFRETERASEGSATIAAHEAHGKLRVTIRSMLGGRPFARELWVDADSAVLRMRVTGAARARTTVTCRFAAALSAAELTMDVPGGVVVRPAQKGFAPTFWAARSFVHLRGEGAQGGLAAALAGPACASLSAPGVLEWVAARNATRERAYGVLPVLAHPASGSEPHPHALDYALWFTPPGDHVEHGLPAWARRVLLDAWVDPELSARADAVVVCDRADVVVTAVKAASRGAGLVVRLKRFSDVGGAAVIQCGARPVRAAVLCDARERDLEPLGVSEGRVVVPMDRAIVSVRLLF